MVGIQEWVLHVPHGCTQRDARNANRSIINVVDTAYVPIYVYVRLRVAHASLGRKSINKLSRGRFIGEERHSPSLAMNHLLAGSCKLKHQQEHIAAFLLLKYI